MKETGTAPLAPAPYVQTVELLYGEQTARFTCQEGDTYWASLDGDSWWLQFIPGEPTEGPFPTWQAIQDHLNDEDL